MIDRLKPYLEYKETGRAWLGSVPRHWSVLPNRAVFAEVKDRGHANEEMLSVTISRGIVPQKALLSDTSKKNGSKLDRSAYKLIQPRDIAYNKMRAWQGAIAVSDLRGIISPAYIVMRLREDQNARYFHHLYRTPQFAKEAERWSYGITSDMWSLRAEHFRMIYSARPPREEQDTIVLFLDHANRRIERAIRAKKKLIALLHEQKRAIIHHAVTRGLDPNVALKPSGIAWLGDIPKHWQTRKIKYLVSTIGGMTPSKGVEGFWGGRIPWVSPKDMKAREIVDSQDHITEAALRRTSVSLIKPPAVLIVVRGMILARTFPTAVTTVPVTVNQDMKALLPKPELKADYLVSLFTGIQRELLQLVEIAGHGTCCLRTDSWENFALPLPPLDEQEAIGIFLKSRLTSVTAALARAEREIELLREYRTRLVADVVTGKLDVRAAARGLPAHADEPATFVSDESEAELIEEEQLT